MAVETFASQTPLDTKVSENIANKMRRIRIKRRINKMVKIRMDNMIQTSTQVDKIQMGRKSANIESSGNRYAQSAGIKSQDLVASLTRRPFLDT